MGMQIGSSVSCFLTGLPSRFEPATDSPRRCSVILDVDETTGLTRSIKPFVVDSY